MNFPLAAKRISYMLFKQDHYEHRRGYSSGSYFFRFSFSGYFELRANKLSAFIEIFPAGLLKPRSACPIKRFDDKKRKKSLKSLFWANERKNFGRLVKFFRHVFQD